VGPAATSSTKGVRAITVRLGGVIYRRYGSPDVQAQPEDLEELVALTRVYMSRW